MTEQTLFIAWQDQGTSRSWFPIGRLDVDPTPVRYRFRYVRGARKAEQEAGFPPLEDFPSFERDYRAGELFPLFKNRVMSPGRPDFVDYLRQMDLSEPADPIEILSVGGGTRATDSFEVFPRLEQHSDGSFRCRFFLHGWRYLDESNQRRLKSLEPGDTLHIALQLTNPAESLAVQLQTADYVMIGWAPRYLVPDLAQTIAETRGAYSAHVVRLNPMPAPSRQRLLVELSGPWPRHDPMTTAEFEPLVA